jgi:hypothetical protein
MLNEYIRLAKCTIYMIVQIWNIATNMDVVEIVIIYVTTDIDELIYQPIIPDKYQGRIYRCGICYTRIDINDIDSSICQGNPDTCMLVVIQSKD